MDPKFAYSFDRESFQGQFATRQQALDAAFASLPKRAEMPEAIFVGRWIEPDLQTGNHAEQIVEAMHDRWNSADSQFLESVTEQQMADLDYEVSRTVQAWFTKHNLAPQPSRVRAVSEHAISNAHSVAAPPSGREMSILGQP